MIVQDITISLNLSDMTREEYQDKIKILEDMSSNSISTHTYAPERNCSTDLTEEELEKVNSLI